MSPFELSSIRYQLEDRKTKLQENIKVISNPSKLMGLLKEVDSALARMGNGTYGLCEVCADPIEENRLKENPLIRFCIDHLTDLQQRELEQDLQLAFQIQNALLPRNNLSLNGWGFSYHYEPAEIVSGDYCDVVGLENNSRKQMFIIGDVSGKGVAASMLMSHLHAMFHSLNGLNLNVHDLVERANRLFCESTLSTHYATLVVVLGHDNGEVEVCNAGHCAPLIISKNKITKINATGVPIGLFCTSEFGTDKYKLETGDKILLYTDGLSEAVKDEIQYGEEKVLQLAESMKSMNHQDVIPFYLEDLKRFISNNKKSDDLTLMTIGRI